MNWWLGREDDVVWCVCYAGAMALSVLGSCIADADNWAQADDMSEQAEEISEIMTGKISSRLRQPRGN